MSMMLLLIALGMDTDSVAVASSSGSGSDPEYSDLMGLQEGFVPPRRHRLAVLEKQLAQAHEEARAARRAGTDTRLRSIQSRTPKSAMLRPWQSGW